MFCHLADESDDPYSDNGTEPARDLCVVWRLLYQRHHYHRVPTLL